MLAIYCAIAATGLLGVTAGASAATAGRPNILFILCDDLGYGDLACYGHPVIKTPHLDALAAEGMRLTDCYAAAPVCSPSRCGLLTGRIPNRLGVYDWIPPGSPMHLRRSEVTIATLLKNAGYATCHCGKWHCNGQFNSREQPQPGDHGFGYWFSTQNNADPSHQNPTNFVRNGKPTGALVGYSSELIVDEAIGWLERLKRDQPFCLFVWFHSPHEPVATAERFTQMYPGTDKPERAIYYGNVTQMDQQVGRLLTRLDELDARDDTFVFFTSDNGPEYRAKHSFGSAGPLRGKKLHLYEGGIRMPGIIRWPGKTRPGQVCHEPITGTDLLPTLCAIAGINLPADRPLDGASFLPIFAGQHIERKAPLYWQYDTAQGGPTVAMRQAEWKVLADGDLANLELYNLESDLAERDDLAQKEPERLKAMSQLLAKIHADVRAAAPKRDPAQSQARFSRLQVDP